MNTTFMYPILTTAGLLVATSLTPAHFGAAAKPGSANSPALLVRQDSVGGVKGKITDSDGKPAEGVNVFLYDTSTLGGTITGGGQKYSTDDAPSANALQSGEGTNKKYGKAVARTTTKSDGTYEFPKRLKPGAYRIEAGTRQTGFRAESVQVKAGEVASKDLQLTPARGGNAGGDKGGDKGGDDRRR